MCEHEERKKNCSDTKETFTRESRTQTRGAEAQGREAARAEQTHTISKTRQNGKLSPSYQRRLDERIKCDDTHDTTKRIGYVTPLKM